MSKDRGPWIVTYTGKRFHFFDPTPEDICIEDIARSLSNLPHWNGFTRVPISVAQHSCYVAMAVRDEGVRLEALLHDASEAYIGDVSAPLKYTSIMEGYRNLEGKIQQVIARKFGLSYPKPHAVDLADKAVMLAEARAYHHVRAYGDALAGLKERVAPWGAKIDPWPGPAAERRFCNMFEMLCFGRYRKVEAIHTSHEKLYSVQNR